MSLLSFLEIAKKQLEKRVPGIHITALPDRASLFIISGSGIDWLPINPLYEIYQKEKTEHMFDNYASFFPPLLKNESSWVPAAISKTFPYGTLFLFSSTKKTYQHQFFDSTKMAHYIGKACYFSFPTRSLSLVFVPSPSTLDESVDFFQQQTQLFAKKFGDSNAIHVFASNK